MMFNEFQYPPGVVPFLPPNYTTVPPEEGLKITVYPTRQRVDVVELALIGFFLFAAYRVAVS